jgi:hypothetical protein
MREPLGMAGQTCERGRKSWCGATPVLPQDFVRPGTGARVEGRGSSYAP